MQTVFQFTLKWHWRSDRAYGVHVLISVEKKIDCIPINNYNEENRRAIWSSTNDEYLDLTHIIKAQRPIYTSKMFSRTDNFPLDLKEDPCKKYLLKFWYHRLLMILIYAKNNCYYHVFVIFSHCIFLFDPVKYLWIK